MRGYARAEVREWRMLHERCAEGWDVRVDEDGIGCCMKGVPGVAHGSVGRVLVLLMT